MTEYSVDEHIMSRFFFGHDVTRDSYSLYVVRDHIFRRSDTDGLIRGKCYSEYMNSEGVFQRANEFEIIPPTLRLPGLVAYEITKQGWLGDISEVLLEELRKAVKEHG